MSEHHITSYKSHAITWFILVILTGLTVGADFVDFKSMTIFVSLAIAVVKCLLVILFFMHVKNESKMLKSIILVAFVVLGLIIMGTFSDYFWR